MRAAGQDTARRYDWNRVALEVLDYYRDVLERHARAPQTQQPRFARVRRVAGLLMHGVV
jgi:hypothetical protein